MVGSITHCAGYRGAAVAQPWRSRGAAVAPATDIAAVGIDAETHLPLPDGVLDAVTADGDAERLTGLARRHPTTHWDRLLFSAKKSVYKAWFPLTRRWLGFEDASLTIDPVRRAFTARIHIPGTRRDGGRELIEMLGRCLAGGLILTAVTVMS